MKTLYSHLPRNTFALIAFTLLLSSIGCKTSQPKEKIQLRVLSYNIHHCRGVDRRLNFKRIANIIKEVNPDIVSLQEVEVKSRRSRRVDQPKLLSELTGLKHHAFAKAINFAGGRYGNAILSKYPILSHKSHRVPGSEPRVILEAKINIGLKSKKNLTFLATHLDAYRSKKRMQSVKIIKDKWSSKKNFPALLVGDLNDKPNSPVLKSLQDEWINLSKGYKLYTYPSTKPREQIDYILGTPIHAWKTIETRVLNKPIASDHRPILSVIQFQE